MRHVSSTRRTTNRRVRGGVALALVLSLTLSACDIVDAIKNIALAIAEQGVGFSSDGSVNIGKSFKLGGRAEVTFDAGQKVDDAVDQYKTDLQNGINTAVGTGDFTTLGNLGFTGPVDGANDLDDTLTTFNPDADPKIFYDSELGSVTFTLSDELTLENQTYSFDADLTAALEEQLKSSIFAGSGAPPTVFPLPKEAGLQPPYPSQQEDLTQNLTAGQVAASCGGGAIVGGGVAVFKASPDDDPGSALAKLFGRFGGTLIGCAGGAAGAGLEYLTTVKKKQTIFRPVDKGVLNEDPSSWVICDYHTVRNSQGTVVKYRYPDTDPNAGVQDFLRKCKRYNEAPPG